MMRNEISQEDKPDGLRNIFIQGKPLSLHELKAVSGEDMGKTKTYVILQSGTYLYFFKSYGKSNYLVPCGVKVNDAPEEELIFF